jgi:hypothetical protein
LRKTTGKQVNLNFDLAAWIEGFAILVAVFIVSGVGSYNDWKKEEQFLKLYAFSKAEEKVSVSLNLLRVLGHCHEKRN